MFRKPVKEINAEFSAESKYLDSIQRTVRESCIAAGMSRKESQAVLLATEEGATNIIRHAYLYQKGVIRLRIVIYPRMVVFSLIDFGRSFQPDSSGTLDLERLVDRGRKGGLGFYMIQKIMDSVQYISSADRNELRMIKRLDRSGSGRQPLLSRMFSLRVKFSFWTFFIVVFIVGGAFYYMDRQTDQQLRDRLDQTVGALAKTVADQASGYIVRSRSAVEFDELVIYYIRANEELQKLVLTNVTDRILAHSEDARMMGKKYEFPDGVSKERQSVPQRLESGGPGAYYLMEPVLNERQLLGYAHVVYSDETISRPLSQARRRIIILTSLLLLFGVVGIYMLSNYFVRPIVKITQRVRRFASGDLESELPLEGAEEFFEISRAFNEIMTRLAQDRKNIVAREKMAREIEVASQIQQTLLPHQLPDVPGLEIDTFYRAASVVGGDLYDVFDIGDDHYCLVVADVSGKGVPASLVMSMLRTVVQISAGKTKSARSILITVNEYMERNIPAGMFVTIMLVVYNAGRRCLNLVSAGHNAMLFFDASSGCTQAINPAGMPLGVPVTLDKSFADGLEEITVPIGHNDLFLVFTDGVTEAVDRGGEQFGMERLQQFFHESAATLDSRPVTEVSHSLTSEIDEFIGFTQPPDDLTFVIARASDSQAGEARDRTAAKTWLGPDTADHEDRDSNI